MEEKKNSYVTGLIKLSDQEFKLISELVYQKAGINLPESKKSLVVARLNQAVRRLNFSSFFDYYDYVINSTDDSVLLDLLDRISTNHTYFFREPAHFDFLLQNNRFRDLITSQNEQEVRIWSAGSSSGEEVYTLALLLTDFLKKNNLNYKLKFLATDLSATALDKGIKGIYPSTHLTAVPKALKSKYFKDLKDGNFELTDEIKSKVLFKKLNLMREEFPFQKKFQIIFCRNVMIYFDLQTRIALVNRFYRYLKNGGYFFIGHSESISRDHSKFHYIQPSVYQKGE